MLSRTYRNRGARGLTLTEAAIVLGIIGLILGGIWAAAASVYQNLRVGKATENFLQIAQGVRSLFAQQVAVPGATTIVDLAKAGAVPRDLWVNDPPTAVSNPWITGVVGTDATFFDVPAAGTFRIGMRGIPTQACIDLLVRTTGNAMGMGLSAASASTGSTATPAAVAGGLPVTLANAITACGAAATASVGFTFNLR